MSETEKAQMAEIRAARGRVKASLTRLENTFDEINTRNEISIRLPKLSIPQFNGQFKDWINFKDLFVSTVHSQVSISNVEKFQYLKGLLTNEPASLIKHMPISYDSYEARQKLLDRYDNKKQTIQSLIKTFLDQKPISEANCFNLRKSLDTSDEYLRELNALGDQASSKDCWLIYL
ncbi:uncharacterized protein TNCV_4085821 [Trichonephila clavipes]|nr:uncharacterized protein TNCV_4085821 [Trichonephila clavipes]